MSSEENLKVNYSPACNLYVLHRNSQFFKMCNLETWEQQTYKAYFLWAVWKSKCNGVQSVAPTTLDWGRGKPMICLKYIAYQWQVNSHAFLKERGLLPRVNWIHDCENAQGLGTYDITRGSLYSSCTRGRERMPTPDAVHFWELLPWLKMAAKER